MTKEDAKEELFFFHTNQGRAIVFGVLLLNIIIKKKYIYIHG